MPNTGNIFAGTGESVARGSGRDWTNPGNVVSDNATDATCAAPDANGSDYLVARNFPLNIPTGATIIGVLVRVEASEHTAGTEPLLAQLQNDSAALIGSSKSTSNGGSISGTAKAVYTYGSISDLWGATLTPAILNDADFGVRLWFATAHDIRIDYVTLQVEYRIAALGDEQEVHREIVEVTSRAARTASAGVALAIALATGVVADDFVPPVVVPLVEDSAENVVISPRLALPVLVSEGDELPGGSSTALAEGAWSGLQLGGYGAAGLDYRFREDAIFGSALSESAGFALQLERGAPIFLTFATGGGELPPAADVPLDEDVLSGATVARAPVPSSTFYEEDALPQLIDEDLPVETVVRLGPILAPQLGAIDELPGGSASALAEGAHGGSQLSGGDPVFVVVPLVVDWVPQPAAGAVEEDSDVHAIVSRPGAVVYVYGDGGDASGVATLDDGEPVASVVARTVPATVELPAPDELPGGSASGLSEGSSGRLEIIAGGPVIAIRAGGDEFVPSAATVVLDDGPPVAAVQPSSNLLVLLYGDGSAAIADLLLDEGALEPVVVRTLPVVRIPGSDDELSVAASGAIDESDPPARVVVSLAPVVRDPQDEDRVLGGSVSALAEGSLGAVQLAGGSPAFVLALGGSDDLAQAAASSTIDDESEPSATIYRPTVVIYVYGDGGDASGVATLDDETRVEPRVVRLRPSLPDPAPEDAFAVASSATLDESFAVSGLVIRARATLESVGDPDDLAQIALDGGAPEPAAIAPRIVRIDAVAEEDALPSVAVAALDEESSPDGTIPPRSIAVHLMIDSGLDADRVIASLARILLATLTVRPLDSATLTVRVEHSDELTVQPLDTRTV